MHVDFGSITSFNIENIKLESGDQIKELLVSEGQKVKENQEIMKVVNDGKERTIKSTISGVFFIIEKNNENTYCIYNLDDIGVKVTFSESDIANISLGQKSIVNIPALEKEVEGTVSYISSLPQNERYVVKIKINYEDEIKFGYSSNISIVTMEKQNVISVPYDFVSMTDDGRYYVTTEESREYLQEAWNNNTSMNIPEEQRKYIKVGTVTSKTIEVVEGLEENEVIIKFAW